VSESMKSGGGGIVNVPFQQTEAQTIHNKPGNLTQQPRSRQVMLGITTS
jgi:hypothetical protein